MNWSNFRNYAMTCRKWLIVNCGMVAFIGSNSLDPKYCCGVISSPSIHINQLLVIMNFISLQAALIFHFGIKVSHKHSNLVQYTYTLRYWYESFLQISDHYKGYSIIERCYRCLRWIRCRDLDSDHLISQHSINFFDKIYVFLDNYRQH